MCAGGAENADAYREWMWALDPCGAGWTALPLPVVDAALADDAPPRTTPDNWPADVHYTPFLLWESTTHAMLRLRTVQCRPMPAVRILKVPPSHPACLAATSATPASSDASDTSAASAPAEAARGLFARCAIPSGTWIGDFTGLVKPQRAVDSSRYLLEVFSDPALGVRFDVDAQLFGNETRFINDFTGLADEPNVQFTVYRHAWTGELAVACLTLDSIKCGAELLADYGLAFWNAEHAEAAVRKSTASPPTPTLPVAPAPVAEEHASMSSKAPARPISVPMDSAELAGPPEVIILSSKRPVSAPTLLQGEGR